MGGPGGQSAPVLHGAESPVRGRREGEGSLPEGEGPGESQQPPERQSQEHETSVETGQKGDQGPDGPSQATSRV